MLNDYTSDAIKHLIGIAQSNFASASVVMGREGPYYMGVRQRLAGNLLDWILGLIGNSQMYTDVVVLTGRGRHVSLPVKVSKSINIGSQPCSWWYRKRAGLKKANESRAVVQDKWNHKFSEDKREQGDTLIAVRTEGEWEENFQWFLDQLRDNCQNEPNQANSKTLAIVDLTLLEPNSLQLQQKLSRFNLAQQLNDDIGFNESFVAARESEFRTVMDQTITAGTDVVFFSPSLSALHFLRNGNLATEKAARFRDRVERRQAEDESDRDSLDPFVSSFPSLQIKNVQGILIHAVKDDLDVPVICKSYLAGDSHRRIFDQARTSIPRKLPSALDELNSLIGLTEIKQQVERWKNRTLVKRLQQAEKLNETSLDVKARLDSNESPMRLNMFLCGPPGVGKTRVARTLGKILAELRLLTGPRFTEVSAKDLIGRYIGESRQKTNEVCEEALGGVLFVDEAYDLIPRHANEYGEEVITTLLKWLDERPGELAFVFAGYEDKMKDLKKANQGLARRIDETFILPPYQDDELVQIANYMVREEIGECFAEPCEDIILQRIEEMRVERKREGLPFGNAGEIRLLINKADIARADRIVKAGFDLNESKMFRRVDFLNANLFRD